MLNPIKCRVRRLSALAWGGVLALLFTGQADAATYYEEQGQLIRGGRSIAALGPHLFGDKVNLYTGATEFVQTDVSLPGNDALPMAVTRRLASGNAGYLVSGSFGRWELDLPRIQGVFSSRLGWSNGGAQGNRRCSEFNTPGSVQGTNLSSVWDDLEYWRGSMLYVPGSGEQELLKRNPGSPPGPSDGRSYPLLTRDLWNLSCISLQANAFSAASVNDAGEGFLARRPDGSSYRFDWLVRRAEETISRASTVPERSERPEDSSRESDSSKIGTPTLMRSEIVILPTEITDRHGNWVRLNYDPAKPWRLLHMEAKDGRRLSFSYVSDSDRISSASDSSRTWAYHYGADQDLSSVQQPDGKSWTFSGMFNIVRKARYYIHPGCGLDPGALMAGSQEPAILSHPSGAVGRFYFQPVNHGRAFVPQDCFGNILHDRKARYPVYFSTNALARKTLSGLEMAPLHWVYAYPSGVAGAGSWSNCSGACPDTKLITVTSPGGLLNRYTFGTRYEQTEGLLLKQEEGHTDGSILRSTTLRSRRLEPVGSSIFDMGDSAIGSRPMPQDLREVTQQGMRFRWEVSGMDTVYARPTSVLRSGPGGSRSETISYYDHSGLWVLGQIDTVSSNGLSVVDNDYFPSTASLRSSHKFGVFQHSFSYHDNGTLASRTDGRGHSSYFDDYKRGLPQRVSYPDGTNESAVVDDAGQVRSVSSAAGYTSRYDYDLGGRLSSITPPSGWTPTTLEFEQVWSPEYGLPSGHWRQTISKGNARNISYFDALWRPLMTRSFDASSPSSEASSRKVVVKGFDAEGRVSFESYPQRELNSVAISSPGRRSRYDALGRLVQQDADSELGVLSSSTDYLDGFQVRHSNPRGKQSTQTMWALDNPSESQLSAISVPAGDGLPGGMRVSIARDAFGKPTSITRSGGLGGNGVSVTRSYVYDAGQRLCKTVEPEVGASIQAYDAAGNIAWRAPGIGFTELGRCDQDRVPATARIRHEHDPVNQLIFTEYGDGSPAVTRSYWPDGKLKSVSTSKGDHWSYVYNSLRLLETETLSHAGQSYGFSWGYDSNGSLSSLNYPTGGPEISYLPNALGEPSRVGSHATGIGFHANGAVAAYTLGNGIVHRMTQNLRGLPAINEDSGVMKDVYSYDRNGNVSGIADQQEGVFHRTMNYDDLDRLRSANAPGVWGQASYSYDAVDNLTSAIVGNRSSTLIYDASNKLSRMISNGSPADYLYDPRGNLTNKGAQSFRFDLGNRLAASSLGGEYAYDGLGRRIQVSTLDGKKRIQVYSQAGQLLWSEALSTGTVPALRTDTCSAGRPVNGQCVTESQYPATERYSCDAGDGEPQGPEHTCTHVSTSNYPAIAKGHHCETGDGLPQGPNFICTRTNSTPYGATPTGYQCNAGDGPPQGPNHSCTSTVPTPYPATVTGRICRAGDGEPQGPTHICTAITVLGQATAVYACPTGYVLGGFSCTREISVQASQPLTCKGHGGLQPDGITCLTVLITVGNVNDDPEPICQSIATGYGLHLIGVDPVPGPNLKRYRCLIGAVPGPSECPAGAVLNTSTNQCITTYNQPASFDHYHCSSGSVSGSSCITSSDYNALPIFSCHAGDPPPVGDSCSHAAGTPYPATPTGYTCNAGDPPPVGSQCTSTSSSTYVAQPTHWECNAGDPAPVGGFCTQTTTRHYRATYRGSACNAGDGAPNAGGMCTQLTVLGNATPVYSCSNGSTPVQGMCPGATTRVGTAYIHLAGKQIAEIVIGGATQYVHTDALGSPVAHTGPNPSSGPPLNRTRFEPYGFPAAGTKPSPATSVIGFTGHVQDAETDLVYMQQRYYDPIAGRFLSVDPIFTDANSGKSFGRYHYAEGNPYKYKDPDGRAIETVWDIASLALSIKEFSSNPSFANGLGVAVDAAAVLIPGIPGGIGAVRAASNAADAAASLPKMKGMGASERASTLKDAGFQQTKVSSGAGKNETWTHADKSEVRVHPYGNQAQGAHKSGNNAHLHKQDPQGDQLNDRGAASTDKAQTHIGLPNPKDFDTVRTRPSGS